MRRLHSCFLATLLVAASACPSDPHSPDGFAADAEVYADTTTDGLSGNNAVEDVTQDLPHDTQDAETHDISGADAEIQAGDVPADSASDIPPQDIAPPDDADVEPSDTASPDTASDTATDTAIDIAPEDTEPGDLPSDAPDTDDVGADVTVDATPDVIADVGPPDADTGTDTGTDTGPTVDAMALYMSGHSLFNLEIPAYLAEIATSLGKTHHYNIQMGIGSNMALRLQGGNEQDKDGAAMTYTVQEEITQAATIPASSYDTLMVTEAVDIFDQLLYTNTTTNLRTFYDLLTGSNPSGQVFLYDSWDAVEGGDYQGWVAHTQSEFIIWECIATAVNADPALASNPARLIPGGVALADAVAAVLAGQVSGLASPSELFSTDGHHLTALGNYFVALVQFSVLYGESPVGSTTTLTGTNEPIAPAPALAAALQALAWQVATDFAETVAQAPTVAECLPAVESYCDGNNYCESLVADAMQP